MHNTINSKKQWQDRLVSQGAILNQSNRIEFSQIGTNQNQSSCFYLQELSCIEVSGSDAFNFLQGQLSCEMKSISITQSGIGSHNNLKGRMLSSFRILQTDPTSYQLIINHDIAKGCVEQLQKYAVFSKVNISINENNVILGSHKPSPELNIQTDVKKAVSQFNNSHAIQINDDGSRFMFVIEVAQCETFWHMLTNSSTPTNTNLWNYADIQEGLAWVQQATQDKFLPQSLNYHLIDGVSFTKGCYIGQEVIIRMQHRGALKKQLFCISFKHIESNDITIGEQLFINEKPIGVIVASSDNNEIGILLAVLREDNIDLEALIKNEDQQTLNIISITKLNQT